MNLSRLLNLKGVNYWSLALSIALNVLWVVALVTFVVALLVRQGQSSVATIQLILIALAFTGPFLICWLVGSLARDRKGPIYGMYGGLAAGVVYLVFAFSTGVLVVMLMVAAIAGGLNGGMISLRNN